MDASDIDLSGQVAVVTGGGAGIGRATALCLADMGCDIAIIEMIPERCEEVAARIAERGRKCVTYAVNVMDADKLREAIEAAGKEFGRIDILINNAGGVGHRPFLDLQPKNWQRHIDLNLTSVVVATHAAVPIMIAGGRGGSVVNVTSVEGSRAAPGYSVYAACKAGVNNLTRTLALEFAEHGIRVNTIAPDSTVTAGMRGNISGPVDESKWRNPGPGAIESARRRVPLGRQGVDMECGKAIVFLCSPMSSYITGITMPVDGGTFASSGWVRGDNNEWLLPPQIKD
jgi:NAD(P)-dependent dehydrogenase (short-subunit alcohol dehydrogenase family)